MKPISLVIISTSLLFFCTKPDTKDALARVGSSSVSREEFETFRKIIRMYPAGLNDYFPGQRAIISYMVETQAIFQKAKWDFAKGNIRTSKDWQWKKRYYPAQVFVMENLAHTLGFSDAAIEQHYTAHKNTFTSTIGPDSTGKDSTVYLPLTDVRDQIVETLFLKKYKPDSTFLTRYGDSLPDQKVIDREWLDAARGNTSNFFMKQYFKETYNTPYPDSIDEVYGKGKIITPEDMEVILSWVPKERHSYYKNAQGTKELVEWLLKWKLFSAKAHQAGFSKTPAMKSLMKWAWKIEIANEYVKSRLIPVAQSAAQIDTAMVMYSMYDQSGKPGVEPDSQAFNQKVTALFNAEVGNKVDSLIIGIRNGVGVKFLQNDWKDEKGQDPAAILFSADSLRDSGMTDEAERLYGTLSREFTFMPEGKRALLELAKIQTERQLYYQAIENYRKYLITGADESRKCNTFFMIGFIYDEYLDKPQLAEINYKWVLKHAPDCELADDAEFMMLHLDEPMSSIEELQAEALRQGRKIEPLEEDTLELEAETASSLN